MRIKFIDTFLAHNPSREWYKGPPTETLIKGDGSPEITQLVLVATGSSAQND